MQHENAEAFFNEAVDPEALGIPDYFDIIKVRLASGADAWRSAFGPP